MDSRIIANVSTQGAPHRRNVRRHARFLRARASVCNSISAFARRAPNAVHTCGLRARWRWCGRHGSSFDHFQVTRSARRGQHGGSARKGRAGTGFVIARAAPTIWRCRPGRGGVATECVDVVKDLRLAVHRPASSNQVGSAVEDRERVPAQRRRPVSCVDAPGTASGKIHRQDGQPCAPPEGARVPARSNSSTVRARSTRCAVPQLSGISHSYAESDVAMARGLLLLLRGGGRRRGSSGTGALNLASCHVGPLTTGC